MNAVVNVLASWLIGYGRSGGGGDGVPFALIYSCLAISSIVSKASASSLRKACSSSYSPGLPSLSRIIRPEPAHPDSQKIKIMRAMRIMEPKEETRPMTTPVKAEDGDEFAMVTTLCGSRLNRLCSGRHRAATPALEKILVRLLISRRCGFSREVVSSDAECYGGLREEEKKEVECSVIARGSWLARGEFCV